MLAAAFLGFAVGHRVDAGPVERHLRMGAGEDCRRQVGGRRHDVGAGQHALHHRVVELPVVASGSAQPRADPVLDGREQGAGSAREVGDAEARNGVLIAPVDLQSVHGELGEEVSAGWESVEGREKLPIADQALEQDAREILDRRGAEAGELGGGVDQHFQKPGRVTGGNRSQ